MRRSDDGIVAQGGDGLQHQVTGAPLRLFAFLFREGRSSAPGDGRIVGTAVDDPP
jgi:hypothetical protein